MLSLIEPCAILQSGNSKEMANIGSDERKTMFQLDDEFFDEVVAEVKNYGLDIKL